jgi:hypothetical protein
MENNCAECLKNEAKERAVALAKKLNIPLHRLKTGGQVRDWVSLTYLLVKRKISIMR